MPLLGSSFTSIFLYDFALHLITVQRLHQAFDRSLSFLLLSFVWARNLVAFLVWLIPFVCVAVNVAFVNLLLLWKYHSQPNIAWCQQKKSDVQAAWHTKHVCLFLHLPAVKCLAFKNFLTCFYACAFHFAKIWAKSSHGSSTMQQVCVCNLYGLSSRSIGRVSFTLVLCWSCFCSWRFGLLQSGQQIG